MNFETSPNLAACTGKPSFALDMCTAAQQLTIGKCASVWRRQPRETANRLLRFFGMFTPGAPEFGMKPKVQTSKGELHKSTHIASKRCREFQQLGAARLSDMGIDAACFTPFRATSQEMTKNKPGPNSPAALTKEGHQGPTQAHFTTSSLQTFLAAL